MAMQVANAREKLANSLQNVVTDAETLLKAAGRDGSEQFSAARVKLERGLASAKDELGRLQETLTERTRVAAKAADTAAHEHPWATAGIAAGIGAVVGVLLGVVIGRR